MSRACAVCDGRLARGRPWRQDGCEHREVKCRACGRVGVETRRDPYDAGVAHRFGAVFQRGSRVVIGGGRDE